MNLIYQYWDGKIPVGSKVGQDNIKAYAQRIGAEYRFDDNPAYFRKDFGDITFAFGKFRPVYDDAFHKYDNVLVLDTDILAKDKLTENIFESFKAEVGLCTEPFQPKFRMKSNTPFTHDMDERWAAAIKAKWNVDLPRDSDKLLKVYNGGLMLFSKEGMLGARKRFVPIKEYIDYVISKGIHKLYARDQNYLHAMLKVAKMNYVELDNGWNSYMHYLGNAKMVNRPVNDMRTPTTKFVHIQLRGADDYDAEKLWRITNLPVDKWNLQTK